MRQRVGRKVHVFNEVNNDKKKAVKVLDGKSTNRSDTV